MSLLRGSTARDQLAPCASSGCVEVQRNFGRRCLSIHKTSFCLERICTRDAVVEHSAVLQVPTHPANPTTSHTPQAGVSVHLAIDCWGML
jgi:hypothetical protein